MSKQIEGFIIVILPVVLPFLMLFSLTTLAIQTQVNEVTDLFDKHIENKDLLLQNMKEQNDNAMEQIKSRKHHDFIEGIDEAEGKINELNSIKETDLEGAGRQKRVSKEYQFYDENELEPDYTKSGNNMHKLDSDEIVTGTEKTMRQVGIDLMKNLIELGFDCKTVKGAIHKEPTYYIEIKREDQKNTEYDQFFCEEPRNQYSCNDSVSLNCVKRGMKWNPWQYREVQIAGDTVYHGAKHLGHAIFWKKKRWGWHLNFDSAGWRVFLSNHLGIPLEQIHPQIHFPGGARGIGGTHPVYEQWRIVFDAYVFGYSYRDGNEICEQWAEDWTERCVLK